MKKVFVFLLILIFLGVVWILFEPDKTDTVKTVDRPTPAQQQFIEDTQPMPESVPESDMEYQSPENAEHG